MNRRATNTHRQEQDLSRWDAPYRDTRDGLWKVALRKPLTEPQIKAGLLSFVAAIHRDELRDMQLREDARAGLLQE
ncbi:hypothetical protein [Actinomadura harenae]|uniref:hypothetical protein n=1 Tax=Actinomadura harenae TaxID=2483351 RepID=UPI0011C3894C|nr:hypothetical protein [Actinomadura harenae]